jgi:hypothetical protein
MALLRSCLKLQRVLLGVRAEEIAFEAADLPLDWFERPAAGRGVSSTARLGTAALTLPQKKGAAMVVGKDEHPREIAR